MLTTLFIILTAVSNSIMDILSFHFKESVFSHSTSSWFDERWWNPNISWKNKYVDGDPDKGRKKVWGINIHPAFLDGWHLFKSLMIIFFLCAIISTSPVFSFFSSFWDDVINFIYLGTIYNLTFSIFYNKILRN